MTKHKQGNFMSTYMGGLSSIQDAVIAGEAASGGINPSKKRYDSIHTDFQAKPPIADWQAVVAWERNQINPKQGVNRMNTTWKDQVNLLKKMRTEYKANESIMTQYECQTIFGEIKRRTDELFPAIAGGAIAEYKGRIAAYHEAEKGIEKARAAEINRWKPDLFRVELQNAETLIKLASQDTRLGPGLGGKSSVGERLQAVYQEAQASGDSHKIRAVCEALQGLDLNAFDKDDKSVAFSLKNQAERDLKELRITDGMVQAEETRQAAWNEFIKSRDGLIDAGKAVGADPGGWANSDPFTQALKLVQMKQDGPHFYNESDPEVTGVSWEKAGEGYDAKAGG